MVSSFRDIVRVPELRKRLLLTVLFLVVYRFGAYVPIPGINVGVIREVLEKHEGQDEAFSKIFGLVNMFAGGAMKRCTIFFLGIMPYISISIILQLLVASSESVKQFFREGGKREDQKKITRYTRFGTVVLCLVQGFLVARWLEGQRSQSGALVISPGLGFEMTAMLCLTTGTAFLMWLGEQITERGIGNGISLIIMAGIVSRMPAAALNILTTDFEFSLFPRGDDKLGILKLLLLILLYVAIVVGIVFIQQAQRRITVQQQKFTRGRRIYGGRQTHLALRVNQAGVIPVIFASSLLTFPGIILAWIGTGWAKSLQSLFAQGFVYNIGFVLLIFFFCFFWTEITFKPFEVADNLKEYGSFIKGRTPGRKTAEYLQEVMVKITLVGAAFLSLIAVLPRMIQRGADLDPFTASFYGGTGLLIVVGVSLEMLRSVTKHMGLTHYEPVMRKLRKWGTMR